MAKIKGLGGVFFNVFGDNSELLEWYRKNLGLEVTEYGLEVPTDTPILVTFKRNNSNAFINFTVDNIKEFIDEMKRKKIEVVSEISSYDYGSFAQIKDLAGNIVELFQVNSENYLKMIETEKINYLNKKNKSNL
ncbi:hypothetical protein RJI07_06795 [Mycoplasmatota bacterium WC30]